MTNPTNRDAGMPGSIWAEVQDEWTPNCWFDADGIDVVASRYPFAKYHRADLTHLRTESILLSKIEELVSDLHDQASAQVNLYDQGWMDFATTLVEEIEKLRSPTQETGDCPTDSPAEDES